MPLSPYYKPLYEDPAFDRPLAQSAFMQQPLPDDNGTDNTGGAPVIPSPAVDPSSTSTANPSLPAVTDTGASSDNPQSAMTQSKPGFYDYLQNYNQGAAKSAIDNANKLAVSPDDIQRSQDRQNLLSLQQGLSTATSQIGNVGGKVQDNDFAKYLENQVQGEKNNLKQRQNAFASAQDQVQQATKNLGDINTQQYQQQLRPLEMQQKQAEAQRMKQQLATGDIEQQQKQFSLNATQESNDPTSKESQITRALLKRSGIDVGEDVSAASGSKLLDEAQKIQKMELDAKNHEELVAARRARDALQAQANEINRSNKQGLVDQKRFDKAVTDVDATKARKGSPFAAYKVKLDNADAAGQVVFTPTGYIKDLNPLEFTEAGSAINNLLGGSNSLGAVQHFIPQTKGMSLAKAKEWLTDHPQPAGLTGMAAWAGNMIGRERGLNEGKLQTERINTLHTYDDLRETDPAKFQELLNKANLTMDEYNSRDPLVQHIKVDEKTGKVDKQLIPYSKFLEATQGGKALQPGEQPIDVAGVSPRRAWKADGNNSASQPTQLAHQQAPRPPTASQNPIGLGLPSLGSGLQGIDLNNLDPNADDKAAEQTVGNILQGKKLAWRPGG